MTSFNYGLLLTYDYSDKIIEFALTTVYFSGDVVFIAVTAVSMVVLAIALGIYTFLLILAKISYILVIDIVTGADYLSDRSFNFWQNLS